MRTEDLEKIQAWTLELNLYIVF